MDRSAVIARLQQFEGCVNYMYRCTGGEVTIGIGHALQTAANASKLNWQTGGAPSPPDRVQSDYQAIAAAPVGQVATAYQHLTQCRMADADIQALVAADVNSFEAQLCKALPNWNTYPGPAQEAIFDMAFNLGIGGLFKFPSMLRAVDQGDWATASAQCHRRGIQDSRNQATAALFLRAAPAG